MKNECVIRHILIKQEPVFFDFVIVQSGQYDGIIVHINNKKPLLPVILVSLFRHMIIFEHLMHVKVYFALLLDLTECYFWDQLAAHRQTHAVSRVHN